MRKLLMIGLLLASTAAYAGMRYDYTIRQWVNDAPSYDMQSTNNSLEEYNRQQREIQRIMQQQAAQEAAYRDAMERQERARRQQEQWDRLYR